jgi:hypothetical protein
MQSLPKFGEVGKQITDVANTTWLVPVIGVVVLIIVIAIIVFVVLKNKSVGAAYSLKGPIDLFKPSNVVVVPRTKASDKMKGSYTLSFYVRIDAVPDMRTNGVPLMTWPGVWGLNYVPAHEELTWIFEQTPDSGSSSPQDVVKLPHVPLQRWNQIVIAFEGRSMDLYINGKLIKSDILSNVPPSAASSISLVPGHCMGQIGYVELWSRRLTTTEVAAEYVNTSDSQGRPYFGPEFLTALKDIKIPNLYCPGGNCSGSPAAAQPAQTWEFPYA